MRDVFVVTHPEATHHVEHRTGGWYDSHLTRRGLADATRIAAALSECVGDPAAIYSSDLARARETADAIAARLGGEVHLLPQLREKSYGVAEGRPDTWLRERLVPPPVEGERMDHADGIEGAETRLDWARRVYEGMDVVLAGPARWSVVVTHGGSVTPVIARWIGMPLDTLGTVSFRVRSGSITHLTEDDRFRYRTVTGLGDVSHLS